MWLIESNLRFKFYLILFDFTLSMLVQISATIITETVQFIGRIIFVAHFDADTELNIQIIQITVHWSSHQLIEKCRIKWAPSQNGWLICFYRLSLSSPFDDDDEPDEPDEEPPDKLVTPCTDPRDEPADDPVDAFVITCNKPAIIPFKNPDESEPPPLSRSLSCFRP